MKQYSEAEIQQLLQVSGGDELERAAAMAVVVRAIQESRELGRIALGRPNSQWNRSANALRGPIHGIWKSSSRN